MSKTALKEARAFRQQFWEQRFEGTLTQWAEGLKLPQSVRHDYFEPDEAPWLVDPLNATLDPETTQVTCVMNAGAAKTLIGEIYIAHTIKEGDGLIYYIWQTDEAARDQMEDRMIPCLEENGEAGIIMPTARTDKRTMKVRFPGVTLYAAGAKPSAAQSKRVKHLVGEETHEWEPGRWKAFKERLNSVANPFALILSTGSILNDETDVEFKTGTAHEWHVRCPYCHEAQRMRKKNLRHEINEKTIDQHGEYNWGEVRSSVYYLCSNERCPNRKWKDNPKLRRQLTASGHYIQTNPNASGRNKSYHISALAVHWESWADLEEDWIKANIARRLGEMRTLKEYVQKKMAAAWDEKRLHSEIGKVPASRLGTYDQGEHWTLDKPGKPDWKQKDADGKEVDWQELTRFMAIDKNEGWFTVEVRAYDVHGHSRLVWAAGGTKPGSPAAKECPPVTTFEECEDIRILFHVDKDRTWLDIADDTQLCEQQCVRFGWQGFWGAKAKNWPHDLSSAYHPKTIAEMNGQPFRHIDPRTVRLPFSTEQRANANSGLGGKSSYCYYYYWSNPTIKDHWHFCHNGGGPGWTQARVVSKAYQLQTNSEIKKTMPNGHKEWDHLSRENHYCDTSQMCHVAAMLDDRIDMGASLALVVED